MFSIFNCYSKEIVGLLVIFLYLALTCNFIKYSLLEIGEQILFCWKQSSEDGYTVIIKAWTRAAKEISPTPLNCQQLLEEKRKEKTERKKKTDKLNDKFCAMFFQEN